MKYEKIPSSLYEQNRQRFMKKMKPNSIAIFPANPIMTTNGDGIYPYKANADVVWLSGIIQEKTMVVLFPDNPDKSAREVLVLLRPNDHLEKWTGHKWRKNEATEISGIQNVQWADSFDAVLQVMIHNAETIYLNTNENDRLDNEQPRTDLTFVHEIMQRFPLHKYERAARIMKELRAIKTKEEVEIMRRAVAITGKAFDRVLQFVKPGVMEYEVEAEIIHEFIRNRSAGHAYDPIVASGDNNRILHYIDNNQVCKDGELLMMDFGAEYGNYHADLTRTIPVNGKFTKRQKELYNAVLEIHNYAKRLLKPGLLFPDYMNKINQETEKQCVKLGLISKSDIKNQDPENPAFRKFFYHGVSHHLGLVVHDVGTRTEAVKEGMLFTVEPGIYIEEEKMGVRIENDIWITKTGNIDLFKGIPITVEEIEAGMKKRK